MKKTFLNVFSYISKHTQIILKIKYRSKIQLNLFFFKIIH